MKFIKVTRSYNTIRPLNVSNAVVTDKNKFDSTSVDIKMDMPLMAQIRNDLEYGVGNRPSVPSCWEDAEELGHVDPNADIRVSKWDQMSDACSMSKRTPEPELEPEPDPTPTE